MVYKGGTACLGMTRKAMRAQIYVANNSVYVYAIFSIYMERTVLLKYLKILLDTDLKIILLDQNNRTLMR